LKIWLVIFGNIETTWEMHWEAVRIIRYEVNEQLCAAPEIGTARLEDSQHFSLDVGGFYTKEFENLGYRFSSEPCDFFGSVGYHCIQIYFPRKRSRPILVAEIMVTIAFQNEPQDVQRVIPVKPRNSGDSHSSFYDFFGDFECCRSWDFFGHGVVRWCRRLC